MRSIIGSSSRPICVDGVEKCEATRFLIDFALPT